MPTKSILNQLMELNLGEINDLIYQLEQFFAVSHEEITNNQKSLQTEKKENEKTNDTNVKTFSVKLLSFTEDKKFSVMKTIKSLFSLNLKETTEILNKLPYILKTTNSESEANKIKKEVEEMGGHVIIE